jgi:phosphotransferase system HPr-like phosphotransfer protein
VIEFIVIVKSGADARTATKLAERVLKEKCFIKKNSIA